MSGRAKRTERTDELVGRVVEAFCGPNVTSADEKSVQRNLSGLTCSLFVLPKKYGVWATNAGKRELIEDASFVSNLRALLQRAVNLLRVREQWFWLGAPLVSAAFMNKPVDRRHMEKAIAALETEKGPVKMFRSLIDFALYAFQRLRASAKTLRDRVFAAVEVRSKSETPKSTFKRPKVRKYKAMRRSWREARPKPIRTDLPVYMPKIAHRVEAIEKARSEKRYGWC